MPVNLIKNVLQRFMHGATKEESGDTFKKVHYKRIWTLSVVITSFVSITPLIVMAGFNYVQYQKALREESTHPIHLLVSTSKRSLEYSLEERRNALLYIVKTNTVAKLSLPKELRVIKSSLEESFQYFVDLGLIDSAGNIVSYAGPSTLEQKLKNVNYASEDWFHEVQSKGVYISDVFQGHRGNPHFVIAVRARSKLEHTYILRATLDMEILTGQIPFFARKNSADAFVINRQGMLQTKTRSGIDALEKSPVPVPEFSPTVKVSEQISKNGNNYVIGYAYIKGSPFIFIMTKLLPDLMSNWLTLRSKLLGFLIFSILVILFLTMTISSILVSRMREADLKRNHALHKAEYAAKMASIGRLAAGVAHEINNPLAIINEKAGLLHDLVSMTEKFPRKEKSLQLAESIINSVERGSKITHRLLGFARHLDVRAETIDIPALIKEVLLFLEKEAIFNNIEIQTDFAKNLPTIESDKGQLQQVFLNIINNSIGAVPKGGRIVIQVEQQTSDTVAVAVTDNGVGIDKKDLDHIFDPFFTTKKDGTGLGLSITYGLVKKMGGEIHVKSKKGHGTCFTVTLPLTKPT